MRSKVLIISPNGVSDVGGVERVMAYAQRVLREHGKDLRILDRRALAGTKIGALLKGVMSSRHGFVWESIAMSIAASKIRDGDTIVIGNGYASCFAKTDILFAHGSARGSRLAKHSELRLGPAETSSAAPRGLQRIKLKILGLDERMEAMAGKRARLVAAVSRMAADEWSSLYGIDPARVRVIPNAVDASHFFPLERSLTRPESGASPSDPTLKLLYVGRLEWLKGIDRLISLAKYLRSTEVGTKGASIQIAAPGGEGSAQLPPDLGIELKIGVRFEALPNLYRASGVLYFPSRYEGFEMVTLEALASGTPVVGAKVGAIAHLSSIKFPGVYIVDPDNLAEVAQTLRRATAEWEDPLRKRELHDRVASEFGLEAWASRFLSVLGEIDD